MRKQLIIDKMLPTGIVVQAHAKTYLDFFAGCGGLSLGLMQAGWKGIFAVEKDPMAFSTFERNFLSKNAPYPHYHNWPDWLPKTPHMIEDFLDDKDARKKLEGMRGKVTLVAGGPPCQGFSVAGSRNGNDPRNQLAFKQLEIIRLVKPVYAIIENVEGFDRRFVSRPNSSMCVSVADEVMNELGLMGYSVGRVILNAADFGVPQLRKRVIIVGVVKELVNSLDITGLMRGIFSTVANKQCEELGLPTTRPVSVFEAIEDLSNDEMVQCLEFPKFQTSTYLTPLSNYARLMRRNIPDGEIPNSHRFNKHGQKVLDLYVEAHRTQPAGRLSKSFLLANNCKSDKKVLLDPQEPCSTLTTHPDEFIHYKYPRNVTLREMARIQSFPDDFWFLGRYTLNGDRRGLDVSRCAQIGNAIPPLVGRGIGTVLDNLTQALAVQDKILEYEFQTALNLSIAQNKRSTHII